MAEGGDEGGLVAPLREAVPWGLATDAGCPCLLVPLDCLGAGESPVVVGAAV